MISCTVDVIPTRYRIFLHIDCLLNFGDLAVRILDNSSESNDLRKLLLFETNVNRQCVDVDAKIVIRVA